MPLNLSRRIVTVIIPFICLPFFILSQGNTDQNPFRQMYDLLPTPNGYRTASGAPGPEYFQQRADYVIDVTLDDVNQRIDGYEIITFYNNAPEELTYLWLQLDQNEKENNSDRRLISQHKLEDKVDITQLSRKLKDFDGGFKLQEVTDSKNQPLKYTVNKTMMRLDLPKPLKTGDIFTFKIKYWYNINDRMADGGRSGYEYFKEDDNYLYTIAQFFPRLCAYNDIEGWQNKQFLGAGEFTLIFGDYQVNITAPEDHLIAATGTLQNQDKILSKEQIDRLNKAKSSYEQPVIIATQKEAVEREKTKLTKTKTWKFKALNVRDFAFASSRKFIWDAMAVKIGDRNTMAMSMYPKEGNPLWEKYSTKAIAHTLKTYSKFTIDYPYPVAWSINADRIGMEYPMISFNFGRCEKDGTYTERTKYGMISVIIHEVGHNFFPMIINSDERQWAWMDEGLNTFVQYLAEQEFERNYPSSRGEAHKIVDYMKGDKSKISPIMTNPESAYQLGNNAYGKPATALNILRETVMGRELFDMAFKEYCRRWAFKQPYPADFFRTMEDASGVDLDWFWRGWFYTNDHVDIAISNVQHKQARSLDPEKNYAEKVNNKIQRNISSIRNETEIKQTYNEKDTTLNDFYTNYDSDKPTKGQIEQYNKTISTYTEEEKNILENNKHYYQVTFERIGDLVMPLIYEIEYADSTKEVIRIPAEIWKMGERTITKVITSDKEVVSIVLDPFLETADIDTENNYFPRQNNVSRFETFKRNTQQQRRDNPMQIEREEKLIKP